MLLTSFSAKGYEQYGKRMLTGLKQFAPHLPVLVYSEDAMPPRAVDWLADLNVVDAFRSFTARHWGNIELAGRKPRDGWKAKDRQDGYCYKFDAMKFCRKVFAVADAARHQGHGSLTWMDADAYPLKDVPEGFFDSLSTADCTYLGRVGTHSECGFIHFRLPAAMPLIGAWENFYASDRFLQETEWHDSFLFDRARAEVPSVSCASISPPNQRGHVWIGSPLGIYFDHLKGDRKAMGYSPERIARGR